MKWFLIAAGIFAVAFGVEVTAQATRLGAVAVLFTLWCAAMTGAVMHWRRSWRSH